MKDEEILKKAYDKAMENGWDKKAYLVATSFLLEKGLASNTFMIFIFSHDFAKTIWGEQRVERCKKCKKDNDERKWAGCKNCKLIRGWQFHLQQLVLQEEPLKYLKQFIK